MTKDSVREEIVGKFHKSTILLAEKLVGERMDRFVTFPFVAKVGSNYALFMPGQDPKKADYDYLHSYVVNAGLTLELKLKHIISVENGTERRGHNLVTLYRSLKGETKDFVSNHIAERVKGSEKHRAIADIAKSELNFDFRWEAEFLLEKSGAAFERWRYLYEEDNSGSWFAGYIELYEALHERGRNA